MFWPCSGIEINTFTRFIFVYWIIKISLLNCSIYFARSFTKKFHKCFPFLAALKLFLSVFQMVFLAEIIKILLVLLSNLNQKVPFFYQLKIHISLLYLMMILIFCCCFINIIESFFNLNSFINCHDYFLYLFRS